MTKNEYSNLTTKDRLLSLMDDMTYEVVVVWQNQGYREYGLLQVVPELDRYRPLLYINEQDAPFYVKSEPNYR